MGVPAEWPILSADRLFAEDLGLYFEATGQRSSYETNVLSLFKQVACAPDVITAEYDHHRFESNCGEAESSGIFFQQPINGDFDALEFPF